MSTDNVIYEVNLHIDPDRLAEFDEWLQEHVRHMLELPGFIDARSYEGAGIDERALRSVRYRLRDRVALDTYLSDHAERMRAEGVARFGDAIRADRRILVRRREPGPQHCRNCNSPLAGQYCSRCGQRHRSRMISVWELLRDVFEDVLDWDSRLWRSLRPLLVSPGKLTSEYLDGRRARFTPPLRMYLVLSLLFFLLSSLGVFGSLDVEQIEFHNEHAVAPALPDGGLVDQGDGRFRCGELEFQITLPGLSDEQLRERVLRACERFLGPGGHQELIDDFMALVPKLLFVMLPLIALAGKAFYLLSHRYYVEHLLFYTHYHSFVFLILIALAAVTSLVVLIPGGDAAAGWLQLAAGLYCVYYLFAAMRRVFGQGRALTGFKLLLIGITYAAGGVLLILTGIIITALWT